MFLAIVLIGQLPERDISFTREEPIGSSGEKKANEIALRVKRSRGVRPDEPEGALVLWDSGGIRRPRSRQRLWNGRDGDDLFPFFYFWSSSRRFMCALGGCAVSEPRVSVIPMSSERKWGVDGGRMLQAVT